MPASTDSSESTNTSVFDKDSANTSPSDHEESSSECDNEGKSMVLSQAEKAAKDDIWFQVLWILKLGPDDRDYLESEVKELLATSPHWHEMVFHIPRSRVNGKPHMISLRKCKAWLRNHATVYDIVAAAEALLNADNNTLKCVFERRTKQVERVKEWLELFDLVVRRVVDASYQNRCVENDKETRQIFRAILKEKEVFDLEAVKESEVLPYSEIKEYANKSRQDKITNYPGNKPTLIRQWHYHGWLQDMKTENGKLPQQSLFHKTLLKERGRINNEIVALRKLEAEFRKEENDPMTKSKRLDDIAQRRDRLKEEQKKVYLETKGDYRRKEEERSRKKREKKEERRKEKAKKGKKAVEWMEVFSGKRL